MIPAFDIRKIHTKSVEVLFEAVQEHAEFCCFLMGKSTSPSTKARHKSGLDRFVRIYFGISVAHFSQSDTID